MKKQILNFAGVMLCCSVLCLTGCGKKEEPEKDNSKHPDVKDAQANTPAKDAGKTTPANTDGGAKVPAEVPAEVPGSSPSANIQADTAVQTVEVFVSSISKNELENLWALLPSTYQDDLNGVVRTFGQKMDDELWNKSFTVLRKLGKILETKQEFLLNSAMTKGMLEKGGLTGDEVKEHWGPFMEIINAVLNSEFSDTAKLKTFDGGKFLDGSASTVLLKIRSFEKFMPPGQPNPLAEFEKASVTGISEEADTAVVELNSPSMPAPEKIEFVKAHGKWLPQGMVEGWDEGIQQMRAGMEGMTPETFAAVKQQALPILGQVEGALDKILAANNQQEFDNSLAQAAGQLMPLAMGLMGGMGGGGVVSPASQVRIIFDKPLDVDVQDDLIDALFDLVDDPVSADVKRDLDQKKDDPSIIIAGPVKDLQAFVNKLNGYLREKKIGVASEFESGPQGATINVKVGKEE